MTNVAKVFDDAAVATEFANFPYIVLAEHQGGEENIDIRNMTVKTPGENGVVLVKNLNLTLKKGSRIVLTGASGSGKTLTTKALLNQWDHGSGLVVMPKGIKIMSMSQQTYFSNTTMRSMLNIRPENNCQFEDADLTSALQAVGLGKLVQHIPGQQVEIMMKDLLEKIPQMLQANKAEDMSVAIDHIADDLSPLVKDAVQGQFTTVQFVPDAQKQFLFENLKTVLTHALETIPEDGAVRAASEKICKAIDIALVQPLYKDLERIVPEFARQNRGKLFSQTQAKGDYFSWGFERSFAKRIAAYMANKDTDDLARDMRINAVQSAYIVDSISQKVKEELATHAKNGGLSQAFNALSWPVSVMSVRNKARVLASDMIQRTTFFMDRQILKGETLTLSGGERQKLVIAMVLLHKPDVLVLDEITAALDPKTGAKLYRDMLEQIPSGTTLLSIAHNEYIKDCHTHHAHLENQTIVMTALEKERPTAALCPTCPHK